MSVEDFQLIDDSKNDDSFIKRGFKKIYHQSGADVNNENSTIKFYFVKNHNFIQFGNGYLEFYIKIRKADNTNFADGDVIKLLNDAFAYTIHDARISSSLGVEIGQNKFVGPISTIMRLVAKKDGDLSTYFDIIDEKEDQIDKFLL